MLLSGSPVPTMSYISPEELHNIPISAVVIIVNKNFHPILRYVENIFQISRVLYHIFEMELKQERTPTCVTHSRTCPHFYASWEIENTGQSQNGVGEFRFTVCSVSKPRQLLVDGVVL